MYKCVCDERRIEVKEDMVKISKMIQRLDELKKEYGDIEIKILGVSENSLVELKICNEVGVEKFYTQNGAFMVLCGKD